MSEIMIYNMEDIMTEIEALGKYDVPPSIICKLLVKVTELVENDKKILEIYKMKIESLVAHASSKQIYNNE